MNQNFKDLEGVVRLSHSKFQKNLENERLRISVLIKNSIFKIMNQKTQYNPLETLQTTAPVQKNEKKSNLNVELKTSQNSTPTPIGPSSSSSSSSNRNEKTNHIQLISALTLEQKAKSQLEATQNLLALLQPKKQKQEKKELKRKVDNEILWTPSKHQKLKSFIEPICVH